MLLDRSDQLGGAADILVVGAGAVGLTLAIQLARAGRRVLVLEAGPAAMRRDYLDANDTLETGRPHGGLRSSRYRGLGGTTRLWGGQLAEFDPLDFAADVYAGKPGWPIDAATLAPFIDAAVTLLGVERGWAVAARWADLADLGGDLCGLLTPWLKQPDFTRLFAADVAAAGGPAIRVDQEVVGLIADGDRIAGVTVRDGDGAETTLRAPATILAAGTAETARLLLRTQAALPTSPIAANDHVGRWFFDHLHGLAGEILPIDRPRLSTMLDNQYRREGKFVPKLRVSPGLRARRRVSAAAITVNTRWLPGHALHDARALAARVWQPGATGRLRALRESIESAAVLAPLAWRYLVGRRSAHFRGSSASVGMELEQIPVRESRLFLEPGVPPGHARIGLHWVVDGREVAAAAVASEALDGWLTASGAGELRADPRLAARDPALLDDFSHSSHMMGGARMAERAADGVTDAQGQVFGMPGLWVAGASTFPSGSFANPTLTAIALGLRLAATLDARFGRC